MGHRHRQGPDRAVRAPSGAVGHYGGLAALTPKRVKLSAMIATSSTTRTDRRKAKRKLNTQQRIFVLAVLEGANNTEAARRAGYKHPGQAGARLFKNVKIAATVQQGQREIALRAGITQDFLVEQTLTILEHALTPVQSKDRYGKPTGPEMRQLGAANTAIFNLAKLTGHWVDKHANAPPNLAEELFRAIGLRPLKLIEQEPED